MLTSKPDPCHFPSGTSLRVNKTRHPSCHQHPILTLALPDSSSAVLTNSERPVLPHPFQNPATSLAVLPFVSESKGVSESGVRRRQRKQGTSVRSSLARFQNLNSLTTAAESVKSRTANHSHCRCQLHLSCPSCIQAPCFFRVARVSNLSYWHPFCHVTNTHTHTHRFDLLIPRSLQASTKPLPCVVCTPCGRLLL